MKREGSFRNRGEFNALLEESFLGCGHPPELVRLQENPAALMARTVSGLEHLCSKSSRLYHPNGSRLV